jgi:hypothetical protein
VSGDDRPHRLTASGIWELPFGRGKAFANWSGWRSQIVGGWQLQGMFQHQSGAPLSFGNVLFTGDIHDIALPADQRVPGRWFNTNAGFEKNSSLQLSSNLRTFPSRLTGARGPGPDTFNLSLLKDFRISERVRLHLRGEFLNAFNRTFLALPNTDPTSTLFGQITGTTGVARTVWVVGKLRF